MEECPNCFRDNAYFDGVEYVCPDCGYTWDCPECPHEKGNKKDDDCYICPECGGTDIDTDPFPEYTDCFCRSCGHHWREDEGWGYSDEWDDDDEDSEEEENDEEWY